MQILLVLFSVLAYIAAISALPAFAMGLLTYFFEPAATYYVGWAVFIVLFVKGVFSIRIGYEPAGDDR